MTSWQSLLMSWNFYPSVIVGCLIAAGFYLKAVRGVFDTKTVSFMLGVLTIFLALCSPLDALGDAYFFSAHMIQHVLLHLVAPPLMIAGLRESFVRSWLRYRIIGLGERFFGTPAIALSIAVATFWIWHYPPFYNATLKSELLHVFEHLTFLVSGTMLWWPVFKPIPERRLGPAAALVYLTVAAFLDSLLGIILTLAEVPFYPGYSNSRQEPPAVQSVRATLGLDPLGDQQLAGASMWALGMVIYLWALMMVMVGWFKERQSDPFAGESPDTVSHSTH